MTENPTLVIATATATFLAFLTLLFVLSPSLEAPPETTIECHLENDLKVCTLTPVGD